MAVKLFVSDLDGTMLESGKEIPAENIKAVKEAVAAGVTVTIATGRMYKAALPVAKALGVDVPIITYNGAMIKSVSGEVKYSSYLKPELIKKVGEFCHSQGWYIQVYSNDELYYEAECSYSRGYETAQKVKGQAVGWAELLQHTENVTKMLTISDNGEETDKRVAILQKEFGDEIMAMKSNANYAEIVNPGVTKATAIVRLAEKMGIAIEDVMAIGDSDNDLPMLKAAGKSVAMGNALEHVKQACDYVTGDCKDAGLAQAIRKYVL